MDLGKIFTEVMTGEKRFKDRVRKKMFPEPSSEDKY